MPDFKKEVVEIMWDEVPRTNTEIAEELQKRHFDFMLFSTDQLAQAVYTQVTLKARAFGMMGYKDGRYQIRKEDKGWIQKWR